MKISQLSKMTNVSTRSIRYYDKKGLITSHRLQNGYRDFDESVIERIQTIQLYLNLGLTIDQIDVIINCDADYPQQEMYGICEEVLEAYEEKLEEVSHQINTLATVKQRLEDQIEDIKRKRKKIAFVDE
ncbi:MerR family transcriptional regulator [Evansella halocellulosilytica]|uniref:MerR family transcriptional regulator n=1 Tax=Evansella halocellulosilytica TaxID=2011013 RepID=UPI000BB8C885|nr:MerR family transcriptional regulator [Evansella halocellulosilytica]